jgi:hypothetical protein
LERCNSGPSLQELDDQGRQHRSHDLKDHVRHYIFGLALSA